MPQRSVYRDLFLDTLYRNVSTSVFLETSKRGKQIDYKNLTIKPTLDFSVTDTG